MDQSGDLAGSGRKGEQKKSAHIYQNGKISIKKEYIQRCLI